MMRAFGLVVVLCGAPLFGCGSDDCESMDPDLCGGGSGAGGSGSSSYLGPNAATFDEIDEAATMAELTGYVLDGEQGIALRGSFESSDPTRDSYQFNSGTFGGATSPDFPGALIQVVIDGEVLNGGISLRLDTVIDHGYSSLTGSYFMNAALFSDEDYVLTIVPSTVVAGKDYTIELRGKTAADL